MKKYALISVSDKTGLVDFSRELVSLGYDIIATGNTAKMIKENGIDCTEVEDLTKFPEIFSGNLESFRKSHKTNFINISGNFQAKVDFRKFHITGAGYISISNSISS